MKDNQRITRENVQQVTGYIHMVNHRNADGTPVRWRINGKCKTWKTRPNEFRVPIKHGLYDYGYLTHENAHEFLTGYGS